MTTRDPAAAPAAPIPRSALVAGAGGSQAELTRDLRAVAMDAASQWTRIAAASSFDDPDGFGRKAAQVYLAALRELDANFGPELKRDWER